MPLTLQAANLSFPLLPHSDDNPKTATLRVVLVDDETGARLEKSIAVNVDPAERETLTDRALAAVNAEMGK